MDNIYKRLVDGMFEENLDDLEKLLNEENLESDIKDVTTDFWSNRKSNLISGNKKKSQKPGNQKLEKFSVAQESDGVLYDLQSLGMDYMLFPVDSPNNENEPLDLVVCFERKETGNSDSKILSEETAKFQIVKMKPINTVLQLELNQLTITEIPAEISKLINLEFLHLCDNRIAEIPREISLLKNLVSLQVDKNRIGYIPSEVGQLENLQQLSITENKIIDVHESVYRLPNLKYLGLVCNLITTLPPEIRNLKNLTTLNLDFNKIQSLPEEILELRNLTNLTCWHNPLDDRSLDILSQLLQKNPKIQLNWGEGLGKKFLDSVQSEREEAA